MPGFRRRQAELGGKFRQSVAEPAQPDAPDGAGGGRQRGFPLGGTAVTAFFGRFHGFLLSAKTFLWTAKTILWKAERILWTVK
jgi:hypothetical protein